MANDIKTTILIATFNTTFQFVERAVKSVLNQTFQNFEIILIDDGSSSDNSRLLLDISMADEHKITYLRQKNAGQSQAINKGVQISKGKYIAILDADDEYLPEHLESCLSYMDKYDLIASRTKTIVDDPSDYMVPDRDDPNKLIHVDDCILFATLFGKKKVFKKLKFRDGYAADADFYDIAKKYFKVGKINLRTYVYYRNHEYSTCEQMKKQAGTLRLS